MPDAAPWEPPAAEAAPWESAPAQSANQDHTTFTGALKEYWNKINPLAAGNAMISAATHPVAAAQGYGQQTAKMLQDSEAAFKRGDYAEGVRHGFSYLLNGIPGLGAALDEAGNKAQSGDYAGAAADTAALATNLFAPQAAESVSGAAARVAGALKTPTTDVLGVTTGVGSTALRQALNNPSPELTAAMRGELSEQDVLGDFKDAVQGVKDQRGAEYRARLSQLPQGKGSSIDISPIKRQLDTQLQNFNIGTNPDGTLDFSRSTVSDPSAQSAIRGTYDDVTSWGTKAGDRQPLGVDTLVRRIGDRYTPNGQARAFIQALKDTGSDTLSQQVPGYSQMKAGYAKASDFLDQLKDLSLESSNPGTAIRKLTTALRQNNDLRAGLIDQLSQYSGKDLTGELAGMNLSRTTPQGLARTVDLGTGVGLLAAITHGVVNPSAAVAMAAASPRLMGELMVAMNKTAPVLKSLSTGASAAAGVTGGANIILGNSQELAR